MTKVSKKIMGGGVLAAIGVSALSPVQQAGALLSVAGTAMWAAPALAQTVIPGVGTVVKRKPGDAGSIIAPTDKDGIISLIGLEPGEYDVKLLGIIRPTTMNVGPDGKLAFVALRDVTGGPDPKSANPRARRALPVVREWVEQVAFDRGSSPDKLSVASYFVGNPVLAIVAARTAATPFIPDVNTSTIEQLMSGTNNNRKAAASIIAEREKNGPYKDPLNFAQRVGSSVPVDFGYSSVRIGDTTIIARGVDPKNPGFKIIPGSGVVELYGKPFPYVGHVTLLK